MGLNMRLGGIVSFSGLLRKPCHSLIPPIIMSTVKHIMLPAAGLIKSDAFEPANNAAAKIAVHTKFITTALLNGIFVPEQPYANAAASASSDKDSDSTAAKIIPLNE